MSQSAVSIKAVNDPLAFLVSVSWVMLLSWVMPFGLQTLALINLQLPLSVSHLAYCYVSCFFPVCPGNRLAKCQINLWVFCQRYRLQWSIPWKIQVKWKGFSVKDILVCNCSVFCRITALFLHHVCSYCRGFVCIITNVASKWGKTKVNYTQLQGLHASYADKGLRILGFPCNQFGGQASEISWCPYNVQ